jgi:tryptophan-rich hypothetical protein
MNKISSKKLLNSKWTAVQPKNKEKHFMVTDVKYDEEGNVLLCILEAVMTKREDIIDWYDLSDESIWIQGWKF